MRTGIVGVAIVKETAMSLVARACSALLAATLLAACSDDAPPAGPTPPDAGDHELTLDHDGTKRRYAVHAPPGYKPEDRLPVVVALHYNPGDAKGMKALTGLDATADEEGFLVVYPEATDFGFNALDCCGSEDDVGFVEAVVATMVEDWNADPARVYATGMSNGAELSYRLAVELPDLFAAIAPVSGGYIGPATEEAGFVPASPVSVITFLGEQDRFSRDFEVGLELWRKRLKCSLSGPAGDQPGVKTLLTACDDGSDVASYSYADMEHSWPGSASASSLAAPGLEPAATATIWEFFENHPKSKTG